MNTKTILFIVLALAALAALCWFFMKAPKATSAATLQPARYDSIMTLNGKLVEGPIRASATGNCGCYKYGNGQGPYGIVPCPCAENRDQVK